VNLFHRRLAHVDVTTVERMVKKGIVEGLELIPSNGQPKAVCEACMEGKQTRSPIPKATETRSDEVLGRVFSDVCEVGETLHSYPRRVIPLMLFKHSSRLWKTKPECEFIRYGRMGVASILQKKSNLGCAKREYLTRRLTLYS